MARAQNEYGTTGAVSRQAHNDGVNHERTALLGDSQAASTRITTHLHQHMTRDVGKDWSDVVLLSCYIITGLLDSSSTFIWGSFLSMQTGNTIYFGLGLVAPTEDNRWIRAGISIACFAFGSYFFSRCHHFFGPRRRWVMVSSFLLQLLCITAAALMVTLGPKTGKDEPVSVWIGLPIALCAFQSAGQAVSSRALQHSALTSIVLTSIYCDLFSDQKLFSAGLTENVARNQRAAAPILLLIGTMIGGMWAHSGFGLAGALWTAVALKAVVVLAWLFWPAGPEQDGV